MSLTEDIGHLIDKAVKSKSDEIDAQAAEIVDLRQTVEAQAAEIAGLMAEIVTLNSKLSEAQGQQQEISFLKAKLARLSPPAEPVQSNSAELQRTKAERDRALAARSDEHAARVAADKACEAATAEVRRLSAEVLRARAPREEPKVPVSIPSKAPVIAPMVRQVEDSRNYEAELSTLRTQAAFLSNSLTAANRKIASLTSEKKDFEYRLRVVEARPVSHSNELQIARRKEELHAVQLSESQGQLMKAQREVSRLQIEIDGLKTKLEVAERDHHEG